MRFLFCGKAAFLHLKRRSFKMKKGEFAFILCAFFNVILFFFKEARTKKRQTKKEA